MKSTPRRSRKAGKKPPKRGAPNPFERAAQTLEKALPELAEHAVKLAKRGKPTLLRVLRRLLLNTNHDPKSFARDAKTILMQHHIPRPDRPK